MQKTKLLVAIGIISLLTACASSPKNGTFAERLMDRGDQAKSIAKKWDEGNSMVVKGESMKKKGQKTIEDGKAQITKGERLIQDGDALIENGKKNMADSESSYQTMRATPVPVPSTTP
jgi:hypothetical protein